MQEPAAQLVVRPAVYLRLLHCTARCIVCVAPTGSEISLFVSRAFLLRVDHGHPEDTADLNAPAYIMS